MDLLSRQPNLTVITGDRHWQYVSRDASTGLEEWSAGPASDAHAGGWDEDTPRPAHRFLRTKHGGFLSGEINTDDPFPTLTLRLHDVKGGVVFEDTKRAAQHDAGGGGETIWREFTDSASLTVVSFCCSADNGVVHVYTKGALSGTRCLKSLSASGQEGEQAAKRVDMDLLTGPMILRAHRHMFVIFDLTKPPWPTQCGTWNSLPALWERSRMWGTGRTSLIDAGKHTFHVS